MYIPPKRDSTVTMHSMWKGAITSTNSEIFLISCFSPFYIITLFTSKAAVLSEKESTAALVYFMMMIRVNSTASAQEKYCAVRHRRESVPTPHRIAPRSVGQCRRVFR